MKPRGVRTESEDPHEIEEAIALPPPASTEDEMDPEPHVPGPFKVRVVSIESLVSGDLMNQQNAKGWLLTAVLAKLDDDSLVCQFTRGRAAWSEAGLSLPHGPPLRR